VYVQVPQVVSNVISDNEWDFISPVTPLRFRDSIAVGRAIAGKN